MGEYWNLFLNWLNNGGGMLYISPTTIPTESDAARIYNGGNRITDHVELGFPIGHSTEGFEAPPTGKTYGGDVLKPSKIIRYVREPGDTLYKYYPEQRGSYGFKYIVPKAASTKMQNGGDYEKLKKVYNTAESLVNRKYKDGKLPRFLDGNSPYDIYGTVGDYYPVGQYPDFYNSLTTLQPSTAELIRDYLFGPHYRSYEGPINTAKYLMSVLDYLNDTGAKQRGQYKGEVKPKKASIRNSSKASSLKSKRDYYSEFLNASEK